MRLLTLTSALTLAALGPACVYEAHDPYGTIAFDWRFDGINNCSDAGVDEVDLVVLQGNEVVLTLEREPCVGGGLEISDIYEGNYEVIIDAFDRNGAILYTGSFTVNVIGGRSNYAGVVNLRPVGAPPPPPPSTGDIELFWGFQYPTNDSLTFDCALAGADLIEVEVYEATAVQPLFVEAYNCTDDGVVIADLFEGSYDVRLFGYGSYHGDDVLLYDSGDIRVLVQGGTLLEMGDVALPRIDENFGDFDVAWTFNAESCASAGIDEIEVAITRLGAAEPDDVVVLDCVEGSVLRRTFVPGSYNVEVFGAGSTMDWYSGVTVDLPPGTVAQMDVVLAPAP
jgi:hypothetical protein